MGYCGPKTTMWSLTRGERGPKTQVLGGHHPAVPFSKTLRPAGRWSTHLDFIPVVSVLLQHSGCVEWSLRHHHRLLEGDPSPWIRACKHLGQHWLPAPRRQPLSLGLQWGIQGSGQ